MPQGLDHPMSKDLRGALIAVEGLPLHRAAQPSAK